jgi:hypothetical protein
MFQKGSKKIRKSLYYFTIFVNNEKINCNKAFSCCLSNSIFQAIFNDASIKEFHFNNVHNEQIFISFFNILFGESFQAGIYSNREVIECFSFVGCYFTIPLNFQNFDDIIWFLSLPFSKNQTDLYYKCTRIVAKNFQKIPTQFLQKLSVQTLELVFNNDNFIRPSQTFLIKLLIQDTSKHCLLKFVDLSKFDSKILKTFLKHLESNEIEIELFENIKKLILFHLDLIHQLQNMTSSLKEENHQLKLEITTLQQQNDSINTIHQNNLKILTETITKLKEENTNFQTETIKIKEENRKLNEE